VAQSTKQIFTTTDSDGERKGKGGKKKEKKSTLVMWQNAALQIGVPMGNSFTVSHKNPRRIPTFSSVMVWASFIKNSQRQREICSK